MEEPGSYRKDCDFQGVLVELKVLVKELLFIFHGSSWFFLSFFCYLVNMPRVKLYASHTQQGDLLDHPYGSDQGDGKKQVHFRLGRLFLVVGWPVSMSAIVIMKKGTDTQDWKLRLPSLGVLNFRSSQMHYGTSSLEFIFKRNYFLTA